MSSSNNALFKKTGLPPGTLVHVGEKKMDRATLSLIRYNNTQYDYSQTEEAIKVGENGLNQWVNINGLHDIELINKMGAQFDLHPLMLEDILNTNHRPKIEPFNNCLFISLKMLGISPDQKSIVSEQISFVLGKKWLLSFQEQEGDLFDGLRSRLKENKGVIRQKGIDYLLYRLIDIIVDNYFLVNEHLTETIDKLEEDIIQSSEREVLNEILRFKKLLMGFRKSVSPLREVIAYLQKDTGNLIQKSTNRYFYDVYEHIIHVNDSIDSQRDLATGLTDLYHSGVSFKMNQVMQVLTIIATIFIPLTFIAGVYGMNFDHIPELHWKYGYQMVWGLMFIVFIFMLLFFRKKKWL